jgi:hypothetical protein
MAGSPAAATSGHTLFVKDNIVTYVYNAFDENYYRIKASKPLAVGRVVRGKYSVPEPFDVAVDNGSLWNAGRAPRTSNSTYGTNTRR